MTKTRSSLSFDDLRRENVARSAEAFNCPVETRDPEKWLNRVVEEFGEVAKLLNQVDNGVLTPEQARPLLAHELGDVQSYLDLLAACVGVDLGEATRDKFNVVSERKDSPRRL